jgi:uncharacterized protein YvpB
MQQGDEMAKKRVKKAKTRIRARPRSSKHVKESRLFEIPNYAQTYEFTSSAACAMMVLKYLDKDFKMKKSEEFGIWQDAISGSVWHGSRYGVAYALAKRGASPQIISSVKDEGYEKKLAVYEGINLDTLSSSFNEIRKKAQDLRVKEQYGVTTINTIKKQINSGRIPIVLVNANALNPYLEASPHWVVVKGYDKDTFYINDPYSDSTVAMDPDTFKAALGYDSEHHMISVSSRSFKKR